MRRLALAAFAAFMLTCVPAIATAARWHAPSHHKSVSCRYGATISTCSLYSQRGSLVARLTRKKETSPNACFTSTYTDVKIITCDETITLRSYRRGRVTDIVYWGGISQTVKPVTLPGPEPRVDYSGMFCKGSACQVFDTDGQLVAEWQYGLLFETCRELVDGFTHFEMCTQRTETKVYGKDGHLLVSDVRLTPVLNTGKPPLVENPPVLQSTN